MAFYEITNENPVILTIDQHDVRHGDEVVSDPIVTAARFFLVDDLTGCINARDSRVDARATVVRELESMEKAWSCALLTVATGCTPAMRAQALIGIGGAGCGAGAVATAAGQDWGALVKAATCWLTDWGAGLLERQRDAERRRELEAAQVDPPELEALDEAAVELTAARATTLAAPCEANALRLANALARCQALEGAGQR